MKIHSNSLTPHQPIPATFALGAEQGRALGGNKNPHLAWADVPQGTCSFVLMCIDTDAPTNAALVANSNTPIPVEHPRGDFVHWLVANIPAEVREIAEGSYSDGLTAKGKPAGFDAGGARGLNDYTGWFAGDAQMEGKYFGYDGPYPPPHDLRTHRYFFRIFALDAANLPLPEVFTAKDVWQAMRGHILDEAAFYATYSLHTAQ